MARKLRRNPRVKGKRGRKRHPSGPTNKKLSEMRRLLGRWKHKRGRRPAGLKSQLAHARSVLRKNGAKLRRRGRR
jgi:hypothetical protein